MKLTTASLVNEIAAMLTVESIYPGDITDTETCRRMK